MRDPRRPLPLWGGTPRDGAPPAGSLARMRRWPPLPARRPCRRSGAPSAPLRSGAARGGCPPVPGPATGPSHGGNRSRGARARRGSLHGDLLRPNGRHADVRRRAATSRVDGVPPHRARLGQAARLLSDHGPQVLIPLTRGFYMQARALDTSPEHVAELVSARGSYPSRWLWSLMISAKNCRYRGARLRPQTTALARRRLSSRNRFEPWAPYGVDFRSTPPRSRSLISRLQKGGIRRRGGVLARRVKDPRRC